MNKHAIILPMLLTSAVSLHALSFYIEEPEELIVENPTPIVSPMSSDNPVSTESQTPENTSTSPNPSTDVKVVVKNTSAPVAPNTAQATPVPVQTNTTIATNPVASPTAGNTIQVAAALIPTKNYDEMLKEAKQIGGRVDPFLSMKPPEVESVPEIPVSDTPVMTASNPKPTFNGITRPGYKINSIPNPPKAWTPEPNITSNTNNSVPPVKNTIPIKRPNGITIIKPNQNKPVDKPTVVIVPESKLDEGLELTGIITGSKPRALIKVDSESKVFGVGDIIRKDGNIKVVSIDYENETVTISNSRNKRTRLDIE